MNLKRIILVSMVAVFLGGLISSCKGDPRKNCNHPDHGRYMQEKLSKKRGINFK